MPSSELDSLVLDWLFCILDRSSLLTYTYLVSDVFSAVLSLFSFLSVCLSRFFV